jgi:hypothetical protein
MSDSRALFFHCVGKTDKHTNAGIEAAFLQFVTAWESFLENATLSFLCGEVTLSPPPVNPKFVLTDIEEVRAILYNGQAYTEWLKSNILINRFRTYFKVDTNNENRLTRAITGNSSVLQDIITIRNEIAHSSHSSAKKIRNGVYNQYNPLKTFARPAEFLVEFSILDPTKTHFIYYVEMMELNANQIIG